MANAFALAITQDTIAASQLNQSTVYAQIMAISIMRLNLVRAIAAGRRQIVPETKTVQINRAAFAKMAGLAYTVCIKYLFHVIADVINMEFVLMARALVRLASKDAIAT